MQHCWQDCCKTQGMRIHCCTLSAGIDCMHQSWTDKDGTKVVTLAGAHGNDLHHFVFAEVLLKTGPC